MPIGLLLYEWSRNRSQMSWICLFTPVFFFLIHYGFYCGSAWFYAATLKFFVSVYWIFDDVLVNTNESTLCFIWIHLEAIYVTVTVFFINSSTVIAKMIEDNKAPCGTPKDTVFIFSLILSDCFLLLRWLRNQYVSILWFISSLIRNSWLTLSRALARTL